MGDENGTMDYILNGRRPGGKAVNGIAPELVQQDAGQAMTGVEEATVAEPNNTQNGPEQTTTPETGATVSVPAESPNEVARQEEKAQLSQVDSIQPQVDVLAQTIQKPVQQGVANQNKVYTPAEIASYLLQQDVETPEQVEARKKREKQEKMWSAIGDGLGAVINLAFAPATGYSNYDQRNSLSEKTRRRWDKLTAERNANNQRWLSIYERAKDREDRANQWKEQFKYKQDQDALNRKYKEEQDRLAREERAKNRAEEVAFRDKQYEDTKARNAKADELKEKEFQERVRVNNANIRNARARLAQGQKSKYSQFYVDGEMLNIPNDALNDQTITAVFSALPEDVQKEAYATYGKRAKGQYGYSTDGNGNPLYEPLTSSQMLQAIGAYSDDENVANMLRVLAGGKKIDKKRNPMG